MKDKNQLKLNDPKSLMEFLQQPTLKIAEVLTGILVSGSKDWKLSAGKLIQATIKGNLLTQLGLELKKYREEGKIKEDFLATDKNRMSLCELLKFIDEEIPDEERFRAIKSLFFASISKDVTEDEEKLAYELMQICKKLSSGELLVLKAAYDVVIGRLAPNMSNINHQEKNANDWLNLIAKQIRHSLPSLVEVHEKNLMELKLISDRTLSDRSGIRPTQHFRLTTLGYKLCEFITKYE